MGPSEIAPPTVSAIMIFLDAEQFIDEAIESVLAQTGIDDWELILVDDGSTDTSTAKAKGWAHRECGRIRYVTHPGHRNEGMSASRNLGLRVARGEFVAFLDSDDIWLPSMLAQRVRLLRDHPEADAVLGPTWTWYGWTGHPLDDRRDWLIALPPGPVRQPIRPPELLVSVYGHSSGGLVPGICSLFLRRQAMLDIGGLEDEFRGLFEDQVLYVKAFSNLTFVSDDRPLTLYRQHVDSACAVAGQIRGGSKPVPNPGIDRFVTWLNGYVSERFGTEGPEWNAVQMTAQWKVGAPPPLPPLRRVKRRLRVVAESVAPQATGALVRSINRRKSGVDGPGLADTWTAQFVRAWTSSLRGRVLVVHGAGSVPAPTLLESVPNATVLMSPLLDVPPEQRFDWVVVLPAVFDEMTAITVLSTCRSLLTDSGSLLALVPGPDLPSRTGSTAERPLRNGLDQLARTMFPAATTTLEGFGSIAAVKAIERGQSAARARLAVDHHDQRVEAMTGLSVIHARPARAVPA